MLAKHIGIVVESADDSAVVLRAPLAPNANYKGTAFGGSLYSVAVLTGWAWVTRRRLLAERTRRRCRDPGIDRAVPGAGAG